MNKKLLLVVIIAILTTVIATGCFGKKQEENNNQEIFEPNTNQGVISEKTVDVFELKNTSLIWNGNSTDLETTVTNTSDEDAYLKEFKIHVYDENNNEIATMIGYVSAMIKAHTSRVMSTGHYANLTNAAKVEYEVIK